MLHIAGIVGGLNADSHNKLLLSAFSDQLPEEVYFELLDITTLPFFNPANVESVTSEVTSFKGALDKADGIVIATPEYNRSIPAPLKNAIDWTSYPTSKNSWADKPVFVMGASTGAIGTAVAQYHLKQILVYLNARILGQPELCVGFAHERFNKNGDIIDPATRTLIITAATSFIDFVKQFKNTVALK